MPTPTPERPAAAWGVASLLFVSGACALVYQIVWMRELRLIFGATTASSAAVLAIFMAGLGLGNAILGRRIDRSPRPLRLYGFLEAGIALSAAVSPLLIDAAEWAYIALGGQSALGSVAATVVRLAASTAIFAVPTFLMGGTMPAAARAVALDSDVHRRGVAWVYGLNTLGAVGGSFLAGFLLLEPLGGRAVLWLACLANLLLAAAAVGWSRRLCQRMATKKSRGKSAVDVPDESAGPVRIVYVSAALVGFAFFLMEIVWYRMLGPILGGTTYTFGLILCLALLGIGAGGALYTILARWLKPTLPLFALTCALEAACVSLPFWRGDEIALWVLRQQSGGGATFAAQVWNWFEVGGFVILPAALVAGFQFPVLIAIAGKGRRNVGRHVGSTFAANTCGAICGSLAGGFFLLPIFSAPGAWQGVVWLLAGLAIVISIRGGLLRHPGLGAAVAVSLLAIWGVSQRGPTPAWRHSGVGAGRAEVVDRGRNAEQDFLNKHRRQCIWEAEGIESSVAITAIDSLAFMVNGKSDGNAFGDAGTQIGLGLVGPLLHPAAASGLVIGLGTGESAGWLAQVDGVTAVDVVELEPAVVEMARHCAPLNCDALQNAKIRLHYNDAREFLLTTRKRYDVIVSEPSNPYRAGVANLYTRDFYRAASSRLNSDGLFLQWLQGYEVDARTVKIVLQTLRSVFPSVQVWRTRVSDLLLVCGNSSSALDYDAAALRRRLQEPAAKEGLHLAWRADDLEAVLAHYVCGPGTVDRLLEGAAMPLNTDDRNLLEYAFAKSVGHELDFSTQHLLALAMQESDDSPVALDEASRDKLARRRMSMHLLLGDVIPLDDYHGTPQQARAEALLLYLIKQYSQAEERFKDLNFDLSCPIETVVFGHTLAEVGKDLPETVAQAIAKHSELEAAAVTTILSWRQGDKRRAVNSLLRTLELLRRDPWARPQLLDAVLRVAGELAQSDAQTAQRIYEQIETPFAVYRMEEERLVLRYILAESLGETEAIEALRPMEPNVPWKGWFLEQRAQLYARHAHPRAAAARRDWQRFQAWEGQ